MTGGTKAKRRAAIDRYEAQPTRMFGAYAVYAHYADGTSEAVEHGTPAACVERARRLNAALAERAAAGPVPRRDR